MTLGGQILRETERRWGREPGRGARRKRGNVNVKIDKIVWFRNSGGIG